MPYQRGEDVNLGVGIETVRGTAVTPAIWIPGRSVNSVGPQVDKVPVRETRGTKVSSQGMEIVKKMGGGELEFNVRNKSFGYLIKSLLGSVNSVVQSGAAYRHTFSILANNPQHPSLTLGLSMPNIQDYTYALALVKSLELRISPDDLVNATCEFVAASEAEKNPDYTPSFGSDDYYFRHQDVVLKIADTVAGIGAAPVLKAKEITISIDNKARDNQNVSELNPGDVIATDFEIGGEIVLDMDAKTYRDYFTSGAYKALSLVLTRADVTIGTAANPRIEIILPKVSFSSYDEDRPIDDIVTMTLGIQAHYSLSDAYAVQIAVDNEKTNYNS